MIDLELALDIDFWDKLHEFHEELKKTTEELEKIADQYIILTTQLETAAGAYEEAAKMLDIEGGE